MFGVRVTLRLGSTVFGISAVLLLAVPSLFLEWLGLDSASTQLAWSMRMIGITLVALCGNMWLHAAFSTDESVRRVGWVMAVAATSLGVLTLTIPTTVTWFGWLYACVGFAFGLNYLACLARKMT